VHGLDVWVLDQPSGVVKIVSVSRDYGESADRVDSDDSGKGEKAACGSWKLTTLPNGSRLGNNAYAFSGGFRLWNSLTTGQPPVDKRSPHGA
jgi:hypothetical protein